MSENTYIPNVLGVFLAVQKKTSLVLVEGEREKPVYEFVVQVVVPADKFQLYTSNSDLFLKVMQKYAFEAYLFRKLGQDVLNIDKDKYLEEFESFTKNYNVLLGNQPVAFDYLIEDRLEPEERVETERGDEEEGSDEQ